MAGGTTSYRPAKYTSRCPQCQSDEEFMLRCRRESSSAQNPNNGYCSMLDVVVIGKTASCPRGHTWKVQ